MELILIVAIGIIVGSLLMGSGFVEKNTTRLIRSVKKAAVTYDAGQPKV